LRRIAAADVKVVVVKHVFEFGDHFEETIVPQFVSDAFELRATQPILADLYIRNKATIDE